MASSVRRIDKHPTLDFLRTLGVPEVATCVEVAIEINMSTVTYLMPIVDQNVVPELAEVVENGGSFEEFKEEDIVPPEVIPKKPRVKKKTK